MKQTMTKVCATFSTSLRDNPSNVIRSGCLHCQQQYIDRQWYALINDITYYSTDMCNKCNVWAFEVFKYVCIDKICYFVQTVNNIFFTLTKCRHMCYNITYSIWLRCLCVRLFVHAWVWILANPGRIFIEDWHSLIEYNYNYNWYL